MRNIFRRHKITPVEAGKLTRTPIGYSRTLPPPLRWWTYRSPKISQAYGPILKIQTAFDSPVHELSPQHEKFGLQVRRWRHRPGQMAKFLPVSAGWDCRAKSRHWTHKKLLNRHEWPSWHIQEPFQAISSPGSGQGHPMVARSKKSICKF